MTTQTVSLDLDQFDSWIDDESDVAALVLRQWLEPVDGKDGIIFPPTYAKPERTRDEDWTGYNIDRIDERTSVCQIDSVGSQANRMEPIFLREGYRELVPSVVIRAEVKGEMKEVNLLEAGHRAADAIVRFSSLAGDLRSAFMAIRSEGNAVPLARIAPTSLVFGAWDSRDTQVKLPRIVRSVIRAYGVRPLHRSAQYVPPLDYVEEGVLEAPTNKTQEDSMSELGLRHAPAVWTHGGVLVDGEIRREASLNLVALRALAAGPGEDPLPLRRYILGLALVAFTAPQETFLREGCQLVPATDLPPEWKVVHHDGTREDFDLSHAVAKEYAKLASDAFEVGAARIAEFDAKAARQAVEQSKEERKKTRRQAAGGGEGRVGA